MVKRNIGILLVFWLVVHGKASVAQKRLMNDLPEDLKLTGALEKIVSNTGLSGEFDAGEDGQERISLAVIDLTGDQPVWGQVYADNFIYPASVYKMYVAMEILDQVSNGRMHLNDQVVVASPNDVDRSREIPSDPRPLLQEGDTVTVNYLLDLMITRSDNSAANCLIDLAGRPRINKTIQAMGWKGSEVTRKFLSRTLEDPGYDTVRSTETCARHAAEFMYRVQQDQLINPWVSMQMKVLLGRQLDDTKLAQGLPGEAMFYHKTGWWSYYTHDVGIVDDGRIRYIIALFTPVPEEECRPKMKALSGQVYELINKRHPVSK